MVGGHSSIRCHGLFEALERLLERLSLHTHVHVVHMKCHANNQFRFMSESDFHALHCSVLLWAQAFLHLCLLLLPVEEVIQFRIGSIVDRDNCQSTINQHTYPTIGATKKSSRGNILWCVTRFVYHIPNWFWGFSCVSVS